MRIPGNLPIAGPALARKRRGADAEREFAAVEASPTQAGPTASFGIDPLESAELLLALQGVEPAPAGAMGARKRSLALLDRLAELRDELAAERLDPATLLHLRQLIQDRPSGEIDPGLRAIVREVETRVVVELAKFGI